MAGEGGNDGVGSCGEETEGGFGFMSLISGKERRGVLYQTCSQNTNAGDSARESHYHSFV